MDKQSAKESLLGIVPLAGADKSQVDKELSVQAKQLKVDADNALRALIAEQKAKLSEMVQQIRNDRKDNTVSGRDTQVKEAAKSGEIQQESQVDSASVEQEHNYQEQNLAYLDTLLDRINATMARNLDPTVSVKDTTNRSGEDDGQTNNIDT